MSRQSEIFSSPSTSTLRHSLPPLRNAVTGTDTSINPSSPLVTIHALNLSLPHPPQSDPHIDALPYHLLLCEMPNALRHSTKRAIKRRRKLLDELESAGMGSGGGGGGAKGAEDQDEVDGELEYRLESIGAAVGSSLAERLSRDRTPLPTTLDVLKFLCKDFWIAIWDKQVDGLRTNHRGVYVLSDHAFKPLQRLSGHNSNDPSDTTSQQYYARMQLPHSVGLLRGALSRLGVNATVVAESAIASNSASAAAGNGAAGTTSLEHSAAVTFHVRTATAQGSGNHNSVDGRRTPTLPAAAR